MRIHYPIETARLQLTPFTATDGEALYALESDPEVKRYAGGTLTRTQTEQLLARFIKQVAATGFGAVAIKLRTEATLIGLCGLYREGNETELFFGLARAAWGQGFATEACCGLIEAAFRLQLFPRIIARVDRTNSRSIHVLKRLGMQQVSTAESTPELCYSISANEWRFPLRPNA